ncbi:hypothetical protein V2J09_005494 [Rumex salicifolius]
MASKKNLFTTLALVFVMSALISRSDGQLTSGFYNGKCGNTSVEQFIFNQVKIMMQSNPGLVGDLTRLSFHDCFVKGCDASVMLDGPNSEKTAPENLNLDGFDDIDTIKAAVEGVCPGVVSCADILVMATRDTINIAGGSRYEVQTGRRDSLVSNAADAANVPGANILMTDAIKALSNMGLNLNDFVVLLGAHTVGVIHCNNFQDRLYNYSGTGKPDPTMDPALVQSLMSTCPSNLDGTQSQTFLDQTANSGDTFDTAYYNQILARRGVSKIDQRLATDPRTRYTVTTLSHDSTFSVKFGKAMVKMTSFGVLTGTKGEVRKICSAVNS